MKRNGRIIVYIINKTNSTILLCAPKLETNTPKKNPQHIEIKSLDFVKIFPYTTHRMHTKKQKQVNPINPSKEAELSDKILRLGAELENIRKRTEQDKINLIGFANANLIIDILPVLDNFNRAALHSPKTQDESYNNWVVGIKAIEKQLEDVLKQNGLDEIPINIGDVFNHNLHEAVSHEVSEAPLDTVSEIVETGYKYNDKILRPVKVKVSAGKKITPPLAGL